MLSLARILCAYLWLAPLSANKAIGCINCALASAEDTTPSGDGSPDLSESDSFIGFFRKLLSADFMPHGHCYWWKPDIIWLHVISDAAITLAYFSIPLMLVYFVRRKKDIPFHWIFLMFGAFIFWCGTTHALNIVTLWIPVYRLDGIVKAITAGVSIVTALCLFPLIPKALALRSPAELEAANASLAEENKRREEAEKHLQKSLKEKEALLREIHHRVKNNFQITSSLLSLQARTIPDTKNRELFLENENRIKSMAMVHEKLYGSESLSEINIKDYIEKLVPNVVDSYGGHSDRIRLIFDLSPVLLSITQAIPLGLILNELVSNAMKHAFSTEVKGEIRVSLLSRDKAITLSVADSGNRFPNDLDFKSTDTLGLQLVNALTKQLDGAVDLNRNGRTEFQVRFTKEA